MNLGGLALIYIPIVLFVGAFLYETWLSFMRLRGTDSKGHNYVDATWEVTHTLLVFAVVMILMLYTQALRELAGLLFLPVFIAAIFLGARGLLYIYLFYIRSTTKRSMLDVLFAITHVLAAIMLVIVVGLVTYFIATSDAPVNIEFIPLFMPGLLLVAGVISLPILSLYKTK